MTFIGRRRYRRRLVRGGKVGSGRVGSDENFASHFAISNVPESLEREVKRGEESRGERGQEGREVKRGERSRGERVTLKASKVRVTHV
jgi:hypothetical protein